MGDLVAGTVDVVFGLTGTALPEDHSFALMQELARCLPWLGGEPTAGIHPIRGASTDYGVLLLAQRAKLVLRLPEHRVADAMVLAGQELVLRGGRLRVHGGSVRSLLPHGALYAHRVAAECDDEQVFLHDVASRLADLGVAGQPVCGRRRTLREAERVVVGFSLMLHALAPECSLLVQRLGIGGRRQLGCGIFVPHRLAAPVGAG